MSNTNQMFCPYCGAKVVLRETRPKGNSFCKHEHVFPTRCEKPSAHFDSLVGNAEELISMIVVSDTPRSYDDLERLAAWCDRTAERVRSMVLSKPT